MILELHRCIHIVSDSSRSVNDRGHAKLGMVVEGVTSKCYACLLTLKHTLGVMLTWWLHAVQCVCAYVVPLLTQKNLLSNIFLESNQSMTTCVWVISLGWDLGKYLLKSPFSLTSLPSPAMYRSKHAFTVQLLWQSTKEETAREDGDNHPGEGSQLKCVCSNLINTRKQKRCLHKDAQ